MAMMNKAVQSVAAAVALTLVLAGIIIVILVATTPSAKAADGEPWVNWGAAPFARTFDEACRSAPKAIDGFMMPTPVKEHFKAEVARSCKSDKGVWLTPETKLEQMWSGPDARHKSPYLMNEKSVAELPVLRSPDGRPYRKGSVAETARAFVWTLVYEGKTYNLYLPLVCFNWSWAFGPPVPTALVEECVEYGFNAPVGGKVHWGVGSNQGPLPPSRCNAQKQGSGTWFAWIGECLKVSWVVTKDGTKIVLPECTADIDFIRKILGANATVPHRYTYEVTATQQTLRFPTVIQNGVIYVCLEYPDGTNTCGVYMRPQDWKGRTRVDIPDALWRKNDGSCPR